MTRLCRLTLFATAGVLALAGCSREADTPDDAAMDNAAIADSNAIGTMQSVNFAAGDGAARGNVAFSDGAGGTTLSVTASGLPAGVHGIHLHEKGLCDGPKFESAGNHWNPGAKQHGRDNPQGAHLGDLANLKVGANGAGTANFTVAEARLSSGANLLADADGTALVVHVKADDYKTDPSGASGDRIACAVIAAPK